MSVNLITNPEVLLQLGWDSFVDSHPEGTIFQSPVMYTLFSGTSLMKPVVIGIADEKTGAIVGILLTVIIRELNGAAGHFSSRAVIYGGPLVKKGGQGEDGKTGRREDGRTGRREDYRYIAG